MTLFTQVKPESFIKTGEQLPATGRGAWVRTGIDFDYRYAISEDPKQRIGTRAQVSLDHWAVSAGCHAIQQRLVELGLMEPVAATEAGIFGPRTERAVRSFQESNFDPDGGAKLAVDGTVGRSDARALFTPLILAAERRYDIPNRLLLGETNHESALDPGAIGYFIYYPDYRGVDRGMSQINGSSNAQVTWEQAFTPAFSLDWSGKRLRTYFEQYKGRYPSKSDSLLWDAAVCAHNNPSAAGRWASQGFAPTESSARYVASVKNAIY